jgi:hypothetical protein
MNTAPVDDSGPVPTKSPPARSKLEAALRLKDYAINHNLPVPADLIKELDATRAGVAQGKLDISDESALDLALRDLTALTYPTTIETLDATENSDAPKQLAIRIIAATAVLLVLAVVAYAFGYSTWTSTSTSTSTPTPASSSGPRKTSSTGASIPHLATAFLFLAGPPQTPAGSSRPSPSGSGSPMPTPNAPANNSSTAPSGRDTPPVDFWKTLWRAVLAVALGGLGALFYAGYNLIGVIQEKAFNANDWIAQSIRFVLGLAIGFILWFAIPAATDPKNNFMLLLPFIAGFSTRLVVGVITKAIQAIEVTLGIDSKTADLQRRKVQSDGH